MITPKNWSVRQNVEFMPAIGKGGVSLTGRVPEDPEEVALTKTSKRLDIAKKIQELNKDKNEVSGAVEKDAALRLQKLKELSKVVDFFEQKINEVPGAEGLQGRVVGGANILQAMAQTNPKIAAYQSSLEGMKALIARGLGDVGNLSEVEQRNAVKLLPNITDNLETRKQKIQNFRDLMTMKGLQSALVDTTHTVNKAVKKVTW